MTNQEYIDTYFSGKPWDLSGFTTRFMDEFEYDLHAEPGTMTRQAFGNVTHQYRERYRELCAASEGKLRRSLWKFMYATMIIPLRDYYCKPQTDNNEEAADTGAADGTDVWM